MKKKVVILGSTGSIGRQTIEVCVFKNIKVSAIACYDTIRLAEEQIRLLKPDYCAVVSESAAKELRIAVADTDTKVLSGEDGLIFIASETDCDVVVNALSGQSGLRPTLAAIGAGKNIALANKETLVTAGGIVTRLAAEKNVSVVPIDSEHCAILQCLNGENKKAVKKLILTASGGPFFGKSKEELECVSPEDALRHPTWSMGRKITVDSATMMNKGLEVIEASWLFDIECTDIDVVIHRESVIHSMVEFRDNQVMAQLGTPDMRTCIQYALLYPGREQSLAKPLNLIGIGRLTFHDVDNDTFPAISYAKRAAAVGGLIPAVLNAANDAAVALFLDGKIKFNDIYNITGEFVYNYRNKQNPSADEIFFAIEDVKNIVNGRRY